MRHIQYTGGYLGGSLSSSLDLGPYYSYNCGYSYGGASEGEAIALARANVY